MAGRLRRCVSCGRSEPQEALLRFVRGAGGLEWDPRRVKPGRGAYVHPRVSCWSRMSEVGRWRHALRCGEELDRDSVVRAMDAVRGEIEDLRSLPPPTPERGRKVRF